MEQPTLYFRCYWQDATGNQKLQTMPAFSREQAEQYMRPDAECGYSLVADSLKEITLDDFHRAFGDSLAQALGGKVIVY